MFKATDMQMCVSRVLTAAVCSTLALQVRLEWSKACDAITRVGTEVLATGACFNHGD